MGFKIRAARLMPLLAMLAMWPQLGWAAFLTGNKLLEFCESDNDVEWGQCMGFIASSEETHETLVVRGNLPPQMCVPSEATLGQLQKVVLKYSKEHPEALHLAAGIIVLYALVEAFPCHRLD